MPGLPAGLAALLLGGAARWPVTAVLFVGTALAINSRLAAELLSDWLLRSGRQLTRRILPGIVKYALEAFAWLVELLERGIYRIDELLRFRPGEARVALIIRGVVGAIWGVVAYVLRLYVNLFIEPTVNPIKHFPVVTVAAKVILPFTPQMVTAIAAPLGGILGPTLAASFGAFTVLVLPGLAGFLAWELNGNWKLYDRTRPELLRAVAIGSHSESMVGFLKPGFHSGTLPKLHTRLRRAASKGDERGVARHREGLHHVEEAIWKFTDRQLVSMLNEAPSFRARDVAVRHVDVASNRVRIELTCPSVAAGPATISFEHQSGWLVVGISAPGWIDALDDEQRSILEIALAGFYKLSGVDLVREQLEQLLTEGVASVPAYDIADEGLIVWPGPGFATEIVFDLGTSAPRAQVRGDAFDGPVPELANRAALFGREPVTWTSWAATWEHLGFGMVPRQLLVGPRLTPIAPVAAGGAAAAAATAPASPTPTPTPTPMPEA